MNNYSYGSSHDLQRRAKSNLRIGIFIDSLFIGGAILASIIIQLFAPTILMLFLPRSLYDRSYALLNSPLLLTLLSGLSIVIPFGIVGLIKRGNTKTAYVPKKISGLSAVGMFFAAISAFMLANIITEIIIILSAIGGITIEAPEMTIPQDTLGQTIYCFSTALIPAVCEEFGFRVVSLQILRKYGDGFAITVTSILFGLLHGNFQQIPFALICGFALGIVTVKSGSVYIAMAAHFCNNLMSCLMQVCNIDIFTQHIVILSILIIGAISLICLLSTKKHEEMPVNSKLPISRFGLGTLFFVSPLTLISVLALLFIAVYYCIAP